MSEPKWTRGPVPKDGYYFLKNQEGYVWRAFYFKGEDPQYSWFAASDEEEKKK
jgi:hypothetical protein